MKKIISIFLVIFLTFNFTSVAFAIEPPVVECVEINADEIITMYVGEEITLEAEAEPLGFSYVYMVWDSDDENIITVDGDDGTTKLEPPVSSAKVTAVGVGTAVITVYADLGPNPYKDEWTEHDSITINVISNHALGDANGDGEITVRDVVPIRRFVAGGYNVTMNESVADVDGDGEVTVRDVVPIRRYVAGGYGVEL